MKTMTLKIRLCKILIVKFKTIHLVKTCATSLLIFEVYLLKVYFRPEFAIISTRKKIVKENHYVCTMQCMKRISLQLKPKS